MRLALAAAALVAAASAHGQVDSAGATESLPAAWADARTASGQAHPAESADAARDIFPQRADVKPPPYGARKSYAIPLAEMFGFAFLLNQVNRHSSARSCSASRTDGDIRPAAVSRQKGGMLSCDSVR